MAAESGAGRGLRVASPVVESPDVTTALATAATNAMAAATKAHAAAAKRTKSATELADAFTTKYFQPYIAEVTAQLEGMGVSTDTMLGVLSIMPLDTEENRMMLMQQWDEGMQTNVPVQGEEATLYEWIQHAGNVCKIVTPGAAIPEDVMSACHDALDAVLNSGHCLVDMMQLQDIASHPDFDDTAEVAHIAWWAKMNRRVQEWSWQCGSEKAMAGMPADMVSALGAVGGGAQNMTAIAGAMGDFATPDMMQSVMPFITEPGALESLMQGVHAEGMQLPEAFMETVTESLATLRSLPADEMAAVNEHVQQQLRGGDILSMFAAFGETGEEPA